MLSPVLFTWLKRASTPVAVSCSPEKFRFRRWRATASTATFPILRS